MSKKPERNQISTGYHTYTENINEHSKKRNLKISEEIIIY